MKCKICNNDSEKIFEKIILQKYNSSYYKCVSCAFVQTDEPIWLKEAYESAITSLDIGLCYRNIMLRDEVKKIIDSCFPESKIYLDYAGGYGLFVRLMRDIGFDFYRQDDYCENIFTKQFDITNIKSERFDITTAFEVFEHFNNPIVEIENVLKYADTLIFSTVITPETNSKIENWWYLTQETGQHIAFYHTKTMEFLAKKFNKNYYSKNNNLHVFTNKTLNNEQLDFAFRNISKKRYLFGLIKKKIKKFNIHRETLLQKDYDFLKKMLNS
jgi:phage pi2 protein 07